MTATPTTVQDGGEIDAMLTAVGCPNDVRPMLKRLITRHTLAVLEEIEAGNKPTGNDALDDIKAYAIWNNLKTMQATIKQRYEDRERTNHE